MVAVDSHAVGGAFTPTHGLSAGLFQLKVDQRLGLSLLWVPAPEKIAASRGWGEPGTSVGGSPAVGHAPSHTEAAHSSRKHRIESELGRLLRDTLRTGKCGVYGRGCVEIVADDGKREVHFQFSLRTMFGSSSQAVVVRKSLDYRKIFTVAAVVEYRQSRSQPW